VSLLIDTVTDSYRTRLVPINQSCFTQRFISPRHTLGYADIHDSIQDYLPIGQPCWIMMSPRMRRRNIVFSFAVIAIRDSSSPSMNSFPSLAIYRAPVYLSTSRLALESIRIRTEENKATESHGNYLNREGKK